MSRLRGLVLTNLFATPDQPTRGTFNQQQFAQLQQCHDLVIAVPMPRRWPGVFTNEAASSWTTASGSSAVAYRVWHPPKIGRLLNAWWLHRVSRTLLKPRLEAWKPQFVLGSFAYPDGVAAVMLARSLGVPAIIKVHGSDINLMARDPLIRLQLRWAFRRAAGVVAVSRALIDRMRQLGLHHPSTLLVYNGIDKTVFRPVDRGEARALLGLPTSRRHILYIGNLKRDKGVFDLLSAFERMAAGLPDVDLEFVGGGAAAKELSQNICAAGLAARVRLHGARPYAEMPRWLGACDVVCLPSHAEGVPNVLVEAQASGRPVVATTVGGIPEVVQDSAGLLVPPHEVDALQRALVQALSSSWDPDRIVRGCPLPSWQESGQRLGDFLSSRSQVAS
jgi:glycosyltransferase involved in cell wall biosynthesis